MLATGVRARFLTSCVSCCNCIVGAVRVMLILFLILFCFLVSC